ncbi:hypothetical protein AAL_02616 [Moelleriella libera RCEF 2490]|uniref:25S rRNA (Uridine(2843)-N(3))-methyltransferase n=1 Tax=Moelleriella libera RCEF 2490 TaxID=1081109 RepID=A0A168ER69_9HYPO|nr:hypothetical protein AAL_02616 [Moelleriella libera RCEF 2490]
MVNRASTGKKKKAASAIRDPKKDPPRPPPQPQSQQQHSNAVVINNDASQTLKQQQKLLDVYSTTFDSLLTSERFSTILQEIKQALYHRDFATAFGNEGHLQTYAARWSPTRTLCYASIFAGLDKYLSQNAVAAEAAPVKMLCIGGCSAEQVAFASFLQCTGRSGSLTLLDSAPWADVTSSLQTQLTAIPPMSKYASEAAKASNQPLLRQDQLQCTFVQGDALDQTVAKLRELSGKGSLVATLMFTLNELYTDGGIGKTTRFLTALGDALPADSLLLVVDSPGSYSEAAIGKEKKKYPMQWLLDHTLMESEAEAYSWERLESENSVWFRLPETLAYPVPLENMRYQMHLYRVCKHAQANVSS